LVCFSSPSRACLWDQDTLTTEAKGLPDVVQVITGRFERNPPLFYEMRLARVTNEVKAQPAKLELYDDVGVACDRLHRDGEAIAWMKQKRARLDKLGFNAGTKEQWYRYHANLGTFLAHDWLRSGANRKNLAEMQQARDEIKRAVQINPNAHFGREKVQLAAMEWIIKPPKTKNEIPDFLGLWDKTEWTTTARPKTQRENIRGLSGLIVLGAAWESVDIYYALELALAKDQESSLAHLANLRIKELQNAGRHTLYPGATPSEEGLMAFERLIPLTPNNDRQWVETDKAFASLRREADDWQAKRETYMLERLKAGRHPDTDAAFWNEWKDNGPPAIPAILSPGARTKQRVQMIFNVLFFGIAGLIVLLGWRVWHQRRAARLAGAS